MTNYVKQTSNAIRAGVKYWANQLPGATELDRVSIASLNMSAALRVITKFVGFSIPFATRNDFRVIDFRPGYVKAFIPLKPNKNHFNAMYAGALFTVAELPGGIISIFSFDDRFFPILKDMKIEFIKMAKTDVTVEFEIDAAKRESLERNASEHGKAEFVLEGEIKDTHGEVVAKTLANYQLRRA